MHRLKSGLETLSTLLVIAAASGLLWTTFVKKPALAATPAVGAVVDVSDILDAKYVTKVGGTGPVAIVEFSDFQCPFCARHAKDRMPELKRTLIDSGEARYVHVHLPLGMHEQAVPAAEAAECANEQGQFWPMHDLLFEKQAELPTADFVAYAGQLQLDVDRFERCVRDDLALARVTAEQKEADRLRVGGTPTFFVGRVRADGGIDLRRRLNGGATAADFVAEVKALRAKG